VRLYAPEVSAMVAFVVTSALKNQVASPCSLVRIIVVVIVVSPSP
jgi:hypothetical protein